MLTVNPEGQSAEFRFCGISLGSSQESERLLHSSVHHWSWYQSPFERTATLITLVLSYQYYSLKMLLYAFPLPFCTARFR
jgi:hypothetical protein